MRRLLAVLICVFLLTAMFTACSKTGGETPEEAPATASAEPEETGKDTTEEPEGTPVGNGTLTLTDEPVELHFWLPVNDVNDASEMETYALDEIVEDFMKAYPQVTVIMDGIGADASENTASMNTAAAADNLPELFYHSSANILSWAPAGVITELTPYLSDEFFAAYMAGPLRNANINAPEDGQIWCAVTDNAEQGWYLNTSLFEQYDLEIPDTFDELLDCVSVFRDNGVTAIAHGGSDTWDIWGYHSWAYRYGFNKEQGEQLMSGDLTFRDSGFLGYFTRLHELSAAGAYAADVGTMKFDTAIATYIEGISPICQVYDLWRTGTITTYESDPEAYAAYGEVLNSSVFKYGFDFSDDIFAEDETCGIRLNCWSVFAGSCAQEDPQKLAACIAFIEFMVSEEEYDRWAVINSTIPLNWTSDLKRDDSEYLIERSSMEAYELEGAFYDEPSTVMDASFVDAYRNAVTGLICGTLDVEGALSICDLWQGTYVASVAE